MTQSNNSGFRPNTFDAALIISQIVAYQSINYISLSLLILSYDLISNVNQISLYPIFDYQLFSFDNTNYPFIWIFLLNSIPSMLALMYLVERAKLCLDFVVTYHLIHLVITTIYSGGFPISLLWWIIIFFSSLITTLGGEYLCYKYELKPIQLSGANSSNKNSNDRKDENSTFIQPILEYAQEHVEEGMELNLLGSSTSLLNK